MIRLSIGTAELLEFNHTVSQTLPTTAYLMLGEHCTNNCSFCTQAKNSSGSEQGSRLSRVTWPKYLLADTVKGLKNPWKNGSLKRICIQTVHCDDSTAKLTEIVSLFKEKLPALPLSISAALDSLEAIREVFDAGADIVNLALDGATKTVYEDTKKRPWDTAWSLLEEASKAFPGRINTHIIAGLGEREKHIAATVQKCTDLGIGVGLFAFTPVKGTFLENMPQPPLTSYRRLQTAVFLIKGRAVREEQFSYDNQGTITDFGIPTDSLKDYLSSGKAFETSGCPGCNRPFYNESPRQTPYNYPRPLTSEEIGQAIKAVLSELRMLNPDA